MLSRSLGHTADDALEPAISELYRSDRKKHDAEAKAQTKKVRIHLFITLWFLDFDAY